MKILRNPHRRMGKTTMTKKRIKCNNCLYEVKNILSLMEKAKVTCIEELRCPKCDKKELKY